MRKLLEPLATSSGRIAGAYLFFGAIWIIVTDALVREIAASQTELSRLQTVKGWLFVLASAGLLFAVLYVRERRLSAEQEFSELALDSLRDVFVVLGSDGRIQRVNERAVEVTGYPESELIGMQAVEAFGIEDRYRVERAINQAYAGTRAPIRATLVTRAGARIEYEFRGRRMVDASGEVRGLVVIGRDVSDQVFTEQRLEVALRVLRHNLRNDLNVIRGWAESLGTGTDVVAARGRIIDTVDKLLSTSDKTRRMAALGGKPDGSPREVDIAETVRQIVEECEAEYPAATIDRSISESDGTIRATGYQLETAIRNVLQNALEHNPDDHPWVRVDVRSEPEGTTIEIADDGPGIPDLEQLVFREGYETPLDHGSGVGLWIVHWCVSDLGGRVELRDREPDGTVVTLMLPASTDT